MNHRQSAKIIPFPEGGRDQTVEYLAPATTDVPVVAWAPGNLDRLETPREEPVAFLEDALIDAKIQEFAFLRSVGRLPPTVFSPDVIRNELTQFQQAGHRLTLALELLRMGQVGPKEALALLPGLRRVWAKMRVLRETLLDTLEPRARAIVQSTEVRGIVGPLDVERELIERSRRRTLRSDPFRTQMSVPGGYVLDMPDQRDIELRQRREMRLAQDNLPANVSADLAGWLENLPPEWLEGIARGLNLPLIGDRWEQEKAVREEILAPGCLRKILSSLGPIERRILAQVLRADGLLRYDQLILDFGGDDETAWHWAEEVPTTPLERVRRTGLLFVGQTQIGRRSPRVAVVPVELREPLKELIDNLPAYHVRFRSDGARF